MVTELSCCIKRERMNSKIYASEVRMVKSPVEDNPPPDAAPRPPGGLYTHHQHVYTLQVLTFERIRREMVFNMVR